MAENSSSASKEESESRGRSKTRNSSKPPEETDIHDHDREHSAAIKRESKSPDGRAKSASRQTKSSLRGRSESPSKFNEKSFDPKRDTMDIKKRQSAIAKIRGIKLDSSEWTRQELIEKLNKFAHYEQDKKSNSGELIIEGKRLLSDDITVFLESMRRFTEIQVVRLNGCFLTDEVLVGIIEGLRNLRHLKELSLVSNLITTLSIRVIIKAFAKLTRKIEILDLRSNNLLTYEDGGELYKAFHSAKLLHGFNLELYNKGFSGLTVDLSGLNMRLCEMGILGSLLQILPHVTDLNLSTNNINSKCLYCLVEVVMFRPRIISLSLSHNPLTNDGTDFKGLEHLVRQLRTRHQFSVVALEGIEHIPPRTQAAITQALQVNRSIKGLNDGYYFNKFITAHIEQKTAVKEAASASSTARSQALLNSWEPKYDVIDEAFVRVNKIPDLTVTVLEDSIILKKKPFPKFEEYKFQY